MSGGRPAYAPTKPDRLAVTALVACGTRHDIIARHYGINLKTFRKAYSREIKEAGVDANAMVAKTLFQQAVGGNLTACIFWLKTRAGWRETQVMQKLLLGKDGKPIDMPQLGISWADGGPGVPFPNEGLHDGESDGSELSNDEFGMPEINPSRRQEESIRMEPYDEEVGPRSAEMFAKLGK